ncbi:ketoacyl-ACP synthase III [Iamia sp. SCSIO 61187]|uniref:beta-ketoacyl-ACP synthase III n=1 Tax=Iamia sp. SCSIO 61187 TaxID=2722752 RepID=UPI001C632962|nr:beta-ketoacyl-ACP synthase III [Iamia sp. SCSIO 61187]QYG92059.1 ketoacyl-ACP synthase III [Iamia sp. SCSIO 61187]
MSGLPVAEAPVAPVGSAATRLAVAFTGWGATVPGPPVTNDDLAAVLDTSDEWIATRTGIRARHVAGPTDTTAALAARAGAAALARAGRTADEVDLLVVATTTPDRSCPSTAADVAGLLGTRAAACDVNAACAGFVAALHLALPAVATGTSRVALVVGAERMTSLVDPTDRSTAVLFGDGAGALVLETPDPTRTGDDPGPQGSRDRPQIRGGGTPGLLSSVLDGDAALVRHLEVPAGERWLRMDGPEVFRAATRGLTDSGVEALRRAGATIDDVAWFVPHQANRRIIDAVAGRLGLAADRIVVTLDRHGNTSAASVPLALAEAADDGRLRPGDLVLLSAVGAGMTWGSMVIRWGAEP